MGESYIASNFDEIIKRKRVIIFLSGSCLIPAYYVTNVNIKKIKKRENKINKRGKIVIFLKYM